MTADAFLDWVQHQQDGVRYELHGGQVIALEERDPETGMVGERLAHARAKRAIMRQLEAGLAGEPCEPIGDGFALRFDDGAIVFPDAMVDYAPASADAVFTSTPSLIFEVLSPSTRGHDLVVKSRRYMSLDSILAAVFTDLEARNAICLRAETPDIPEIASAEATLRFELPSGPIEIDLRAVLNAAGGV